MEQNDCNMRKKGRQEAKKGSEEGENQKRKKMQERFLLPVCDQNPARTSSVRPARIFFASVTPPEKSESVAKP